LPFPQKSYSRLAAAAMLGPACFALAQSSVAARAQFEVAAIRRNTSGGAVYPGPPVGKRFAATKLPDATSEPCGTFEESLAPCGGMSVTSTGIVNQRVSMQRFARVLWGVVGRPVVDKTGFTRPFSVHLEFAPIDDASADISKPSVFTAVQEQLGLKLESGTAPVETLVIDHVQRPSEN